MESGGNAKQSKLLLLSLTVHHEPLIIIAYNANNMDTDQTSVDIVFASTKTAFE